MFSELWLSLSSPDIEVCQQLELVEQISDFVKLQVYFLELIYLYNLHLFDNPLPVFFLCECCEEVFENIIIQVHLLWLLSYSLLLTFTSTYLVVSLSCLSVQFILLSFMFNNILHTLSYFGKLTFFEVFGESPIHRRPGRYLVLQFV